MVEDERLVKKRKRNMKLYSFYRTFAQDVIFVYAIKILFLTTVNGVQASDIVFSVSMYALFMVILQIPATILIQKIGYRKSAFISNLFNMIYIAILMFSTNVVHLCIAEFASAVTFALKDVAEPSLLNVSIPKTEKKGKIYSKIAGRGQANYYFFDAITAMLSGFFYAINPYLPMILSIVISAFACIISLLFEEIEDENEKQEEVQLKGYMKDLKESFGFILKSKRLRSLMIYSGITWGFMCLMGDFRGTILTDIGTPSQIFGIITAIFGIVSAVASKKQVQFHNIFKNHSLCVIAISCSIAMLLSGVIVMIQVPVWLSIIVLVLFGIVGKSDMAMSQVLVNRYLGNFASKKMISKIYSANSIIKNFIRMVIGVSGSILLASTTSANAMFIGGIVFFALSSAILIYMKPRVGLKPEEYSKEEIEMKIVK